VAQPHEMVVTGSSESGAEEWSCRSCTRRVLLRWPPHHERIVLSRGDDRVVHVGGRHERRAGSIDDPAATGLTDRERRWLRDNGIAWDDAAG
jgi:hypothetical protein